jgi:hypothetical protein
VTTCSFEYDPFFLDFIDQQPIRFNMTLPPSLIIPNEFVIFMDWIKGLSLKKCADDDLNFLKVLSSLLDPLDVLLELPSIDRGEH